MTTKREHIEALLAMHDTYVGSGNVKASGRLVPRIIRSLMDYVDNAVAASSSQVSAEDSTIIEQIAKAPERRVFYIDVGNVSVEEAKEHIVTVKNELQARNAADSNYTPFTIIDDYLFHVPEKVPVPQTCKPCSEYEDLTRFGLSPEAFEEAKLANDTLKEEEPQTEQPEAPKKKNTKKVAPAPKTVKPSQSPEE